MSVNLRHDSAGNIVHVDGVAECGKVFPDIAIIHNPDSDNPALQLNASLGFSAIRDILTAFESGKERKWQALN